jgi:hypothetical protein
VICIAEQNLLKVIKSRTRRAEHVEPMVKKGIEYILLLRKHERKKPFGGPRLTGEDNIKINLKR